MIVCQNNTHNAFIKRLCKCVFEQYHLTLFDMPIIYLLGKVRSGQYSLSHTHTRYRLPLWRHDTFPPPPPALLAHTNLLHISTVSTTTVKYNFRLFLKYFSPNNSQYCIVCQSWVWKLWKLFILGECVH